MKTFVLTFFAMATVALAQTNQLYVTDKISTNYDLFCTVTNQAVNAAYSPESRPTRDDPEGNWGQIYEGFQLSIRLEKANFTNDEPITASIIFRNVTNAPIKFLFFTPMDQALRLMVLKANNSNGISGEVSQTFESVEELRSRRLTGKLWRVTIPVMKQCKFIIGLTNFYNLAPGIYKIQAQQDVVNFGQTKATNVASGFAAFKIVSVSGSQ